MIKIKYIRHDNGQVEYCYPASEMFDSTSKTRELLKTHSGVDFNNKEEIISWIIKKDVTPRGHSYEIIWS